MELFNAIVVFFMILDPLGNVPLFASVLKAYDPAHQRRIILRESFVALIVMLIFLFFGKGVFRFLAVDPIALELSGGIILFLIALKLIFTPKQKKNTKSVAQEPYIVPLAVPAFAGPGILATISLYGASKILTRFELILATVLSWLLCVPILLLASNLRKVIGDKGLLAIEKLVGFIVVLLAVQMSLNGIEKILATFFAS